MAWSVGWVGEAGGAAGVAAPLVRGSIAEAGGAVGAPSRIATLVRSAIAVASAGGALAPDRPSGALPSSGCPVGGTRERVGSEAAETASRDALNPLDARAIGAPTGAFLVAASSAPAPESVAPSAPAPAH